MFLWMCEVPPNDAQSKNPSEPILVQIFITVL